MGSARDKNPLPLRYYAANDRTKGWREVSKRVGNAAADADAPERTDSKRGRKSASLVRWIMREFNVDRGEAIAKLQQEKRKHAAQRMRGDVTAIAREKSAERLERKAINAINADAQRAERIANYLRDKS